MAQCITCGSYYRRSPYNQTNECDGCVDQVLDTSFDEEDQVELSHLMNPTGKTAAKFSDE